MGKNLITQKRGRGGPRYRAPSHRYIGSIKYRPMDAAEREGKLQGVVVDLVHSSGHSGPLALVKYENGEKHYLFAPIGIRVGDPIEHGSQAAARLGSVMPLKQVPDGATVYNIEGTAGDGGCFVRVSGTSARVMSHAADGMVAVEMPSRKQKIFAGEWKRGTTPELWDGHAAERIINILAR